MSVRRLGLTTAAMAAAGIALRALAGPWRSALRTLAEAVVLSSAGRPEDVVLAATGLLAWVVWTWGALGLLLTAAAATPGAAGALARGLSRLLLPARLRTATGLALGVGLVVTAPASVAAPVPARSAVTVPDWPADDPVPAPPDWPSAPSPVEQHVVAPGDCLWRIAEDRLVEAGRDPTAAEVARAVDRWWSANATVIGPDPDLIHPGQVLLPPPGTTAPTSTEPESGSTR